VIRLTERPYLFVDETLVERHNGTSLRLHSPERKVIALVHDAPWEGPSSGYHSVVDTQCVPGRTERYLLFYRGMSAQKDLEGECTCVAESPDGIEWQRRLVWKYEFAGSRANNIVWNGEYDISHNMSVFRDDNPAASPDARFKAIGGVRHGSYAGPFALGSPDGIVWRFLSDSPVMTKSDFDSQNLAFWDTEKGCYVAYLRKFIKKRSIERCLSDDFIHWSEPERLRFHERIPEHLYTNAINPYDRDPGLYLGFPSRFIPKRWRHREHGHGGINDCVLIASRDGLHFPRRFREAFIRPGLDQRNWTDRSLGVAPGMIRTSPTEYSLYWSEHCDPQPARLVRGTIRVDGFASLHADMPGGEAHTAPVRLDGDRLVVNLSTSAVGGLRVEIQDAHGRVIPGYSLDDADELFGDDIERTVTWKGSPDISRLHDAVVRMRIALADADLYSLACQ